MKGIRSVLAGGAAGLVNGLLGTGGGMVLVPLLRGGGALREEQVFPASVAIILPLCPISLAVSALHTPILWAQALPYLLGGTVGGVLAGIFGKNIPVTWLHRILGALILWGGIRYLCP